MTDDMFISHILTETWNVKEKPFGESNGKFCPKHIDLSY